MEQMRAIWSALDEMLEQDPQKYQEFIKAQMESARSANASGSGSSGQPNITSILSSLAQRNSDQKSKEKVEKVELAPSKEKVVTEEVIKEQVRSMSLQYQHQVKAEGEGNAVEKVKLASSKEKVIKTDEDVIKEEIKSMRPKREVKAEGDAVEKVGFELQLPPSVAPTKVKPATGRVLIQEISSTDVEDKNNFEDESTTDSS